MKEKRMYEKPSMRVHVLKQRTMLLVGSAKTASASIDDYEEDNTFTW